MILHKSHDIPDGHNDEEQNPKGYISNVAPHIIESTADTWCGLMTTEKLVEKVGILNHTYIIRT